MLKKKNIYVIFITVFIAFLVSVSSFLGLVIYMQWRQFNYAINYYETLEKFDTISNVKNITVGALNIKPGSKEMPVVDGEIKNKGKKTVVSVTMNVKFLDSQGKVVYEYIIYPLEPFRPPRFLRNVNFPHVMFLKYCAIKPGSAFAFKSTLLGCPESFMKMLQKNEFSSLPGEWSGRLEAEIVRIKLR